MKTFMICISITNFGCAAWSQVEPLLLDVSPNPLSQNNKPWSLEIYGPGFGSEVHIEFFSPCEITLPSLHKSHLSSNCKRIAEKRITVSNHNRRITYRLSMDPKIHEVIGKESPNLLIQAKTKEGKQVGWINCSVTQNPCALFETLRAFFRGGPCKDDFGQMFNLFRGPDDMENGLFQITVVDLEKEIKGSIIPGTLGATGVAFIDEDRLLCTFSEPDPTGGDSPLVKKMPRPGLAQLELQTGKIHYLWKEKYNERRRLVAPGIQSDGTIVFASIDPTSFEGESGTKLHLLTNGKIQAQMPLPTMIDQVIPAKGKTPWFLVSFMAEKRKTLALIEPFSGSLLAIGDDPIAWWHFHQSPDGQHVVLQEKNATDFYNADLVLYSAKGDRRRTISPPNSYAVLPSWSPQGKKIAFLTRKQESMPKHD